MPTDNRNAGKSFDAYMLLAMFAYLFAFFVLLAGFFK